MPIYDYECDLPACSEKMEMFSLIRDRHIGPLCQVCKSTTHLIISRSNPLTNFRENKGQWIENMGHEPVYITSHEQHKREMKARGLEFATPKRGMPGSW